VRIARVAGGSGGQDYRYGVVEGPPGEEVVAIVEGDPLYRGIVFTGERIPLAGVRLVAPVLPRSKIVGIGRNYAEHAAELGNAAPDQPLLFLKPNTTVIGPLEGIVYPRQSAEVDYEGELAVVIGRLCREVPRDGVAAVVFGYTCGNDVTARDLQRADGQWTRAKGFDTFCPLGPWIETVLDPADVAITTTVNGDVRQSGRTSLMVHDVPAIVSYVSGVMTLLPGDVILTGTPAGVGPLAVGDQVTVAVEGVGALTNRVVARD
jgi:2-keto-4-pentenoate hydratase/2-oxohepta-3-ene-1,7-dioic acid hydratase in catechol pathway